VPRHSSVDLNSAGNELTSVYVAGLVQGAI